MRSATPKSFTITRLAPSFKRVVLDGMTPPGSFSTAGLFAGVGGIELGLHQAGAKTELLCEWWEPACRQFWPNAPRRAARG